MLSQNMDIKYKHPMDHIFKTQVDPSLGWRRTQERGCRSRIINQEFKIRKIEEIQSGASIQTPE